MSAEQNTPPEKRTRPFLGVHFIKCGVYSRLYKDATGSSYTGICPRCGTPFRIAVDSARGTKQRFFVARCP